MAIRLWYFAYRILFILSNDFCKCIKVFRGANMQHAHTHRIRLRMCHSVFVAFQWFIWYVCWVQTVTWCPVYPWRSFILFNLRYTFERMWCLWNWHIWALGEIKRRIHTCFYYASMYKSIQFPIHTQDPVNQPLMDFALVLLATARCVFAQKLRLHCIFSASIKYSCVS